VADERASAVQLLRFHAPLRGYIEGECSVQGQSSDSNTCFGQDQVCPDPVFVVGAPRSGTTVLASALGRHTEFWNSAESFFLYTLFAHGRAEAAYLPVLNGQPQWLGVNNVSQEEFLAYAGLGFNALFTSRSGGRRWVEKTPIDTLIIDTLAGLFPGAKFVHILRDARTTVRSMLSHRIATRNPRVAARENVPADVIEGEVVPEWTTDFRVACLTWRRHVRVALEFGEKHPERCLTVRHDLLVSDPEETFRQICVFLGAGIESGPAEYCRTHTPNSSFETPRQRLAEAKGAGDEWTVEEKHIFLQEVSATQFALNFMSAGELADMEDEIIAKGCSWVARWRPLAERLEEIAGLHAAVARSIEPGASVLVVSKGDEELVRFPQHRGEHFPQAESGDYAGYYPGTDVGAVDQLEQLRGRGAEYLVFPKTSFWWLDHYREFQRYLDERYSRVVNDDFHVIFRLLPAAKSQ
jgi:hypothetical protein